MKMTTRIISVAALIAASGLALHVARAQLPATKRIDLQRHDLSVPGREAVQVIVEVLPGMTSPRHTHPGEEIIYILEGSLEYQVEGKPPVTLKPGGVLFIPERSSRRISSRKGSRSSRWSSEHPMR